MINVLSLLCSVQAQTNFIYPIQGQTYFHSLERVTTITPNSQFSIQEMLTVQASSSNLMSSNIIDMSEGSLAGNQNFQNQLIGILSESTTFYEYFIQYIDANGITTTILQNTTAMSKKEYFCTVVLIIANVGFIQCIAIQNNQLIIFYQQEQTTIFQTLDTNIFANITQLQLSDLNYFQNTTGEYLISTLVTTQSNIYCIPISNPNSSTIIYSSYNTYQQISYLEPQNILMLRNITNFELFINSTLTISFQSKFDLFSYYLFAEDNTLMVALYNQSIILIQVIDIITESSYLIESITLSDINQDIYQMFMNSKYLVLTSREQLSVYYYGEKSTNSNMFINQDSFTFFMSQSNYIGMILNNQTQLGIQINQPALICYSCNGNGSFNLSNDQGITQYEYFTLQNGDLNIYPKRSDIYNNYTIIYSTPGVYALDSTVIGQNLSAQILYPNSVLSYTLYMGGATALPDGKNKITFFVITFVPESLLFVTAQNSASDFCILIGYLNSFEQTSCIDSAVQIYSAISYQISTYQTIIYMNTGSIIMNRKLSSLANQTDSITLGPSLNVSADSNTTFNIIAMASFRSNLYVLIPNMLLIYDINSNTLSYTFNFNFRNIWTSDEYQGFVFCDNYQNLMVYQFTGDQYIQITNIPYQIQNTSSIQIGLLIEGIFILELNQTSQGVYFYNRQNIQMIQINQISVQEISIGQGVVLTNITTFTSKYFYLYAINEGQSTVFIYKASESSFASLYQTVIQIEKVTQISCAANLIEQVDVCYFLFTEGDPLRIYIMHVCVINILADFVISSVSSDITLNIYNGYANLSTNITVYLENPQINIEVSQSPAPIITNQTQDFIWIDPQKYFIGCIQNYTIQSNDSNVTLTQLINQVGNYSYETDDSIQTLGYIFLANTVNISIINGSQLNFIYTIPSGDVRLNLFVEVNTGFPAWLTASTTILWLNYYNMTSLSTIQIQMMEGVDVQQFYGYYYNGPLIVGGNNFYCFNVTLEQNQLITTQLSNSINLNQNLSSSATTPQYTQFLIDSDCFGFIYSTLFMTIGVVTINIKDGLANVYQDVIKYTLAFTLDYQTYGGKQLGQASTDDNMRYISIIMADWFQFYQLNLHFQNSRFISHNISNLFYHFNEQGNSYAIKVAASNNVIVFAQLVKPQSILSLYPVYTKAESIIPTIAYLNISNVSDASESQYLNFISDNLLIYSYNKVTLIYTIYDQLMINYTLFTNSTNIQLTAQNLFSQQTQNIPINQWQPPIIPPSISQGFNYWIILWIFLGLILIVIIILGIVFYRKSRREREQEPLANSENYAELAHR